VNRLHRWYCRSPHWQRTLERLVPWALDEIDLGSHVLEVGAGPGLMTPMLAARAPRVTALDLDVRALARAGRAAPRAVHLVAADATQLPFPACSFTSAVAFAMLHHVPTTQAQDAVFREIARTLRPGGVFVAVEALDSIGLRLFHLGDTFRPVTPAPLGPRVQAAGFRAVAVTSRAGYLHVHATVPPA
jgi:ubiquinone/menaquinone biosynthesis C-methylase UbiE